MEWVGIYLHDAHERIRGNITGDLDWTLSDTCKTAIHNIGKIADNTKTTLKHFVRTKLLDLASLTSAACSPMKSGKVMNMHST